MSEAIITCPKCGEKIPLTEALTHEFAETFQKKAREEISGELKELQRSNLEKENKLRLADQKEVEMIRKTKELEEKAKTMELEVIRKVEIERKKIEENAQNKASEEFRMQVRSKDEQLDQMRRTIDDLKRKSEQGSMQIQGEIQEHDLKNALILAFPSDVISDVPTGINGADLVHIVKNRSGFNLGCILWESKNTKHWSDGWIQKLKDDQVQAKADVCIIVSQTLPPDIKGFGIKDGIWLSAPSHAILLANAMRYQLMSLSQIKASIVGKDEKMEALYSYLTSTQFKSRVENIVVAFKGLREELDKERRSTERMWARREKELERVMKNTLGMYGDFEGLIGSALPAISSMELPEGNSEDEVIES